MKLNSFLNLFLFFSKNEFSGNYSFQNGSRDQPNELISRNKNTYNWSTLGGWQKPNLRRRRQIIYSRLFTDVTQSVRSSFSHLVIWVVFANHMRHCDLLIYLLVFLFGFLSAFISETDIIESYRTKSPVSPQAARTTANKIGRAQYLSIRVGSCDLSLSFHICNKSMNSVEMFRSLQTPLTLSVFVGPSVSSTVNRMYCCCFFGWVLRKVILIERIF